MPQGKESLAPGARPGGVRFHEICFVAIAVVCGNRPVCGLRHKEALHKSLKFRVVGYLPGMPSHATITPWLRAGVAQASMVETAELILVGVPGTNAMGI